MRRSFLWPLACVIACGGSADPAKSPEAAPAPKAEESTDTSAPSEETEKSEEREAVQVPTACADGGTNPCLMPRAFVKRLCAGTHPELALYFFAKNSPWTRIYVAVRQMEPFNGLGGPSSDKNLEFEEELLVLTEHSPNLGGMTVSGVGKSYDVLRWDGTCATLQESEIRTHRPGAPKHANVEWKRLNDDIRDALSTDEKVASLAEERRKECKGVTMGAVSDKCEKADKALRTRIVKVIRDGLQVPMPSRVPE